ncbi:MAG: hypothetical protein HY078_15770 [Elusimicrobia bacterium]|nr:hypothetical protein [Elusimicrobiota bacterium]
MNEKVRHNLALAALVILIPAAARAASLESLARQADLNTVSAFPKEMTQPAKILHPVDVFEEVAECRVVDIRTYRPLTLAESVEKLQPCMVAISQRYAMTAAAKSGPISEGPNMTNGIQIRIEKVTQASDSRFIRDIHHSLAIREGRVFNHPVRVLKADKVHTQVQSSLQTVVDSCEIPHFIRALETAEDFNLYYGACLSSHESLKIEKVAATGVAANRIGVWSAADESTVAQMNGWLTVPGGKDTVTFLIEAHRKF